MREGFIVSDTEWNIKFAKRQGFCKKNEIRHKKVSHLQATSGQWICQCLLQNFYWKIMTKQKTEQPSHYKISFWLISQSVIQLNNNITHYATS